MSIPAMILPSSMLLFSIAVALIVSTINLFYKAQALKLERAQAKKQLAEKMYRMVCWLFVIAVVALIAGVYLFNWYVSHSLIVPTDNIS
jgi:hypothetical protein